LQKKKKGKNKVEQSHGEIIEGREQIHGEKIRNEGCQLKMEFKTERLIEYEKLSELR
jgi:hypothetical protein